MSLDVWLNIEESIKTERGSGRIYIRDKEGSRIEITREEWDKRFPGHEPILVYDNEGETHQVWSGNITHNLNQMADAAGIYKHLWRPEELGITKAKDLIAPLTAGLVKLTANPKKFKAMNPSNGWGTYEGLVKFVGEYITACDQYPEAAIGVWR